MPTGEMQGGRTLLLFTFLLSTGLTARGDEASSAGAGPALPRWSHPRGAENRVSLERERAQWVRTMEHPSGARALVYPERPRYAVGKAVVLWLDLKDPRGLPLSGRRDLEIITSRVEHDATGATRIRSEKSSFVEQVYDRPGRYKAILPTGPMTDEEGLLLASVSLSETGNPSAPGRTTASRIAVQTGFKASLQGGVEAHSVGKALQVRVPVVAHAAGPVTVRAQLVDGAGRSLGEAVGSATFDAPGAGSVTLTFKGRARAAGPLYLKDVTLWLGSDWTDFWSEPAFVGRSRPAASGEPR